MDRPLVSKHTGKISRRMPWRLLIRRVHLYFGLFLVPWVLLYGVSAFLFNHPNAFSRSHASTLPFPEGFRSWSDPDRIADQVVAALARESSGVRVARVGSAGFESPVFMKFQGETAGNIRLDLDGRPFLLQTRKGSPPPEKGPLDGPLAIEAGTLSRGQVMETIRPILVERGIEAGPMRMRPIPAVVFVVRHEGQLYRASYDIEKGVLTAHPNGERPGPDLKNTLLRLHTMHHYTENPAQWAWALIVDIMALAMVIWSFTGIYMWWQMKKLRGIGGWVMVASVVTATALGAAMYAMVLS